jgi:hypothetical protein
LPRTVQYRRLTQYFREFYLKQIALIKWSNAILWGRCLGYTAALNNVGACITDKI